MLFFFARALERPDQCPLIPNLIQVTRVHKTRYDYYAIGVHTNAVRFNLARPVITRTTQLLTGTNTGTTYLRAPK